MSRRQTTLATQPGDVSQRWHIVDATGISLGRLAAEVAQVLMGKHRPDYTPHTDTGEFVVVTNAKKIGLTGRKGAQRLKMRYSSHPGGLRTQTYDQVRESDPELLIQDAVRRMMPKNRLSRFMIKKLKVVNGTDHSYGNHKPKTLTVS